MSSRRVSPRRCTWTRIIRKTAVCCTPLTAREIECYFARLQRRDKPSLHDLQKHIRLAAGGGLWGVRLGRLAEQFVIEGEEPYDPAYTLFVSPRVLRAIVEGRAGWEEALLSHRITLRRNPDVFDRTLMEWLRDGSEPVASTPKPDVPVAKERCRETLVTRAADLS